MTRLREMNTSQLQQNTAPTPARNHYAGRWGTQFAAVVVVLIVYLYPSLRARAEFGGTSLPPIFAPDLSLYLNLSSVKTVGSGQVLNPYYLVPVPARGTAYLKFRLGPVLFNGLNHLLGGRMWLAMFIWNLLWWALLCVVALWLFERFLPIRSPNVAIAGLGLLMLVNIGMAKLLLAAWVHLPSLAGFQGVILPFIRAFAPQIPIPLLLGYLGLQMIALRGKSLQPWIGMAVVQLLALSAFPYATLVMAGITLVSVSWQALSQGVHKTWQIPLVYGAACAVADGAFLMRGSMNIYASHSSLLHFQPKLLPHLVGLVWVGLCALTVATALSKTIPPEVKWPLVGLGTTNVMLMLGDAVVPSTALLLSAHASYFAQTTIAVLFTFLISAAMASVQDQSKTRLAIGVALFLLTLNGMFQSVGNYRAFLPANREQVAVTRLLSSWSPTGGELLIARSLSVDDACGWVALLSKGPVLYCSDAEIMLTSQQNRELHRFRQALYLYFSGKDTNYLQQIIHSSNPGGPMYQLGYWAEGVSLSREEQQDGLRAIQTDLLPFLEQVERRDPAASYFFHQFSRVIVLEDLRDPTFFPTRLGSFLKLEGEQHVDNWVILSYIPD